MKEEHQIICCADHISKSYRLSAFRTVQALQDITLEIREGETVGLVGESGSGKSTLGRQLVGLENPSEGKVLYRDKELSNTRYLHSVRTELQMVFQDTYAALNPRKTVYQSIFEPMKFHRLADSSNGRAAVQRCLEMAELSGKYLDRYPHELSGGQRQRVCIAKALSLEPKLVIWDEPVSALDVTAAAQILELMKNLQKELKLTSVFIGHGIGAVAYVSQRLAVLKQGRLVEVGNTEDIIYHPQQDYTKNLIQAARY